MPAQSFKPVKNQSSIRNKANVNRTDYRLTQEAARSSGDLIHTFHDVTFSVGIHAVYLGFCSLIQNKEHITDTLESRKPQMSRLIPDRRYHQSLPSEHTALTISELSLYKRGKLSYGKAVQLSD